MAMTANNEYQGWTNYPTWAVNLWVNNDYDVYHYLNRQSLKTEEECREFVESLQYLFPATYEGITRDIYPDYSFSDVDWHEIWEAWNES
jgi:hypothetical protein